MALRFVNFDRFSSIVEANSARVERSVQPPREPIPGKKVNKLMLEQHIVIRHVDVHGQVVGLRLHSPTMEQLLVNEKYLSEWERLPLSVRLGLTDGG